MNYPVITASDLPDAYQRDEDAVHVSATRAKLLRDREDIKSLRLFQEVAREDSETEEEDEYDFEGEYSSRRQRQLQRRLWLVLASLMLVAAGLGVLVYFKWRDGEGVQVPAYRFCFFFAAWPVLWMLASFINKIIFNVVEVIWYRKPLLYMHRVRHTCRLLLFAGHLVLAFLVGFRLLPCSSERACQAPLYLLLRHVLQDVLLCGLLFCLANFLTALVAKVLSREYYQTAHAQKVVAAIEKEYFLAMMTAGRGEGEQQQVGAKQGSSSSRPGNGRHKRYPSDRNAGETLIDVDLGAGPHARLLGERSRVDRRRTGHVKQHMLHAVFSSHTGTSHSSSSPLRSLNSLATRTFTALVRKYAHMSSRQEAEQRAMEDKFAKVLYANVRTDLRRDYLLPEDLHPFFPDREDSEAAFRCFDKDNDGRLTAAEVHSSVAAVFTERKHMAQSLRDTDSIVKSLEIGIGCVMHFVFLVAYLWVFEIDISQSFTSISAFAGTTTGLGFMFKDLVKEVFENYVFLFAEHAYDVGDMLKVEREGMIVKKVNLMSTLMLLTDTWELVTYPNSKLREMPIINASKSANRMDHTAFLLDVGTPLEVLKRVEQAGTDHLRAHQPDFDDTEVMMIMHGVMDPYKVKVSFWWTYSFTADDIVRFCLVRSAVVNALQMELKVVGVQHTNMYLDRGNAQQRAAAQRLV